MSRKAAFLDRDGVINFDPGDYTCSLQEFTILDGALAGMKLLNELGFDIILITNQGGVAKSRYTIETLNEIHTYLLAKATENGVVITDIYFCPHHPDYSNCLCRKPNSLLVEKAIAKHYIDAEESIFIGDKQRDLDAGNKVGVKGLLFPLNSNLLTFVERHVN